MKNPILLFLVNLSPMIQAHEPCSLGEPNLQKYEELANGMIDPDGRLNFHVKDQQTMSDYAELYAYEAHLQMRRDWELSYGDEPLRLDQVPNLRSWRDPASPKSTMATERVSKIFHRVIRPDATGIPRMSLHSVVDLNQTQQVRVFFPPSLSDHAHNSKVRTKFYNFLMENNDELLPSYRELAIDLYHSANKYYEEAKVFKKKVSLLNPQDIKSWLDLENYTPKKQEYLLFQTQKTINDLSRLRMLLAHIVKHHDTIQVMDMYFLAEQALTNTSSLGDYIAETISKGVFNFSSPYEPKQKPSDVKKLYQLKGFPVRNSYLLSKSIAIILKDFANSFRKLGELPAIPDEEFAYDRKLEEILNLNPDLMTIDEYIEAKKNKQHLEYLRSNPVYAQIIKGHKTKTRTRKSPTIKNKSRSRFKKKRKAKTSQASIVKTTPKEDSHKDIDRGAAPRATEADGSKTIALTPKTLKSTRNDDGAKIFNILDEKHRHVLTKVYQLDPDGLSQRLLNEHILAIYQGLIEVNRSHLAAAFLRRTTDIRALTQKKSLSELVSIDDLKKRLVILLDMNIVPPNISDDELQAKKVELDKQLRFHRFAYSNEPISEKSLLDIEEILMEGEKIIHLSARGFQKRSLSIKLAHNWHRLALSLEKSNNGSFQHREHLNNIKETIVRLLKLTQPLLSKKHAHKASILESYLFSYYLNIDLLPCHRRHDHQAIKMRAYENLKNNQAPQQHTVFTIDTHGNVLKEEKINNSIFHAITNEELGDYIFVKFNRSVNDKEIPKFINFRDKLYRTDVFGGSFIKTKLKDNNFGRLIGVEISAGEYFTSWFASEESHIYAGRSFMPKTSGKKQKSLLRKLRVATIPDSMKRRVLDDIIIDDGFSIIRSSVASELGLESITSPKKSKTTDKNLTYQAIHGYLGASNLAVAQELFENSGIRRDPKLKYDIQNNHVTPSIFTPTKRSAVGIPVGRKGILLPDNKPFVKFAKEGILLGRNPYDASILQAIDGSNIAYAEVLNEAKVFQYSLTGFSDDFKNDEVVGLFLKGIAMVVPDQEWPPGYDSVDVISSSSNIKLNQLRREEKDKLLDKNREQVFNLYGILHVTQEMHNKDIIGIPRHIATDKLAGDYDGDEYDVISASQYPKLKDLIHKEMAQANPSPKIDKSFSPSRSAGVFSRIIQMRKPILEMAVGILGRYYYMEKNDRRSFADHMVKNSRLTMWISDYGFKENIENLSSEEKVAIEIQRMIKFGEDRFKTNVNVDDIMERSQEYLELLDEYQVPRKIPYGNSNPDNKAMLNLALQKEKSSNIADKTFRAIARYINDDNSYGNGYVSDDDQEVNSNVEP